jgi:hypothetical protein
MRSFGLLQFLTALVVCTGVQSSQASVEVPFQFRDGLIWVDVKVPGSPQPLQFILDSGAEVSVIDRGTAGRLGLKPGKRVSVSGVGATEVGYWPQTLDARAGGMALPRTYLMLDLAYLSQTCTNGRVEGIIGADFFRDRVVQIDYQQERIRLLPPVSQVGQAEALPLKVGKCGMLVPIRVNNSSLQWVRLDTGCASSLQWVTKAISAEQCGRRMAVGLARLSLPVTTTSVRLGSSTFEHVPTDLHTKAIFPGEKGLLGNGLLARFNTITIDAKNGWLYLR